MAILQAWREHLTRGIATALSQDEDFTRVVKDATGYDPYEEYTSRYLSRRQQISEILTVLEKEGSERWLLTYVLVGASQNDQLPGLIAKAYPQWADSEAVEQRVNSVVEVLETVFRSPLAQDILLDLHPKQDNFDTVLQQNAQLLFCNRWQELLQRLHATLAFGLPLDSSADLQPKDPERCGKHVAEICERARKDLALLGDDFERKTVELSKIAEIERLGSEARSAGAAGNLNEATAALVGLERVLHQQLSRLNAQIFELAKKLSLPTLVDDPPTSLLLLESYPTLRQCVRNLTPTVLARVLMRKLWQEALNEIALMSALMDAGLTRDEDLGDHWHMLKGRIRRITELEPEAPWSKPLNEYAKEIDFELADPTTDGKIAPIFARYRRAAALGFLSALLKLDFAALEKINPKLRGILEEIAHV